MNDKRYQTIKDRLCKLHKNEIERIVLHADILCLDTYNYDANAGTYCPLALAMNLHNTINNPTDATIQHEISKRFMPVNVISGVDGSFYRENRKEDIIKICGEILKDELYCS